MRHEIRSKSMLATKCALVYDGGMSKTIAIFLPPLPQFSGGLVVLLQLGNRLASLGHAVEFVLYESDGGQSNALIYPHTDLPIKYWADVQLTADHVWLVPDGWTNALILGIQAGARCVMYMQSWCYGLRTLPDNVLWHQLPVDFVYVSEPVRYCLQSITGKDGPILRPTIDGTLFQPSSANTPEDAQAAITDIVRIAWMPRKNKIMGEQIKDALSQRMAWLYPHKKVQWVELHRIPHKEVGSILNTCHIFLATGFPEGCPLPPLEAMSCGCIPVGFHGLGGWDYMRSYHLPGVDMPYLSKSWIPLCDEFSKDFAGNGFFVEDADVLGASFALEQAILLLYQGGPHLATLRKNVLATAAAYSQETQSPFLENFISFILE